MKYLHLIWANLKRRKARTALTALSIIVAFVLFGYLAAINQAFGQGVDVAGLDRLIVRHRVSIIQLLPESYEMRIERLPGVSDATHATWFGGVYQNPRNFFAQMPVDAEEFLAMYPEYVLSDEERRGFLETRTGAIAGRVLADRFGWKVGDRIPLTDALWSKEDGSRDWQFDLVGIYDGAEKATDTSGFFFRYDFFDESRSYRGEVGWYYVKIGDPERAAEIAEAIDREFANSPAETKTEPEKAFLQGFAKQMGNITLILMVILAAVFFTILLVAGNTMAQSVRERTEELGVLKALGFTHRGVVGLVLGESLLLAGVAGLAGLLLAWLMASAGDPTGGALPVFFIPGRHLALGVGLVALLGLAAGLPPALQARRLEIAEAMRR